MREPVNDSAARDRRTLAELFPGEVLLTSDTTPPLPGAFEKGPVPLSDHTVPDFHKGVAGGVGARLRRPIVEWLGLLDEADYPGQVHYEWRGDVLWMWDDPYAADRQPRIVKPDAHGRYLILGSWTVLSDDAAQRHLHRHGEALITLADAEHPTTDPVLLDYLSRPEGDHDQETDGQSAERRAALIEAVQRFDPGIERGREYDRITAARTAADAAVAHHARQCVQAAARAVLRFHPDAWTVVVDLHDHDLSGDAPVVLEGVRDHQHNDVPFSDHPQWHHTVTDVERWLTEALVFLAPEHLGWSTDLSGGSLDRAIVNLRAAPEPRRCPFTSVEREPTGHVVIGDVDTAANHDTPSTGN